MSWVIVTATAMVFVVGVTCSPIDDLHLATDLLPPEVDGGPMLSTDLMPPPASTDMPEQNWPATDLVRPHLPEERTHVDGENKNNAIEQIIADNAEEKTQEATQQPQLGDSGLLMKIRSKRHSKYKKKKHSYGGGCGYGCGGYYYQPRPVYYKVIVVQPVVQKTYYRPQPTCHTCGGGGGGYSYAQASAQASSYSYGR